jgi:hypothetical protein
MAAEQGYCRSIGDRRHRSGSLFAAETTLSALALSDGFCAVIRDLDEAAAKPERIAA